MKGRTILVMGQPRGPRYSGPIGDTSKPGTIMQVKTATEMTNGDPTYIAAAPGTDGVKVVPYILIEDHNQGKTVDDAFVNGTLCEVAALQPGEDFNGRLGEVAGTGNTGAIGDPYMIDAEDGLLVPWVGATVEVFAILMETITQVAGGTLCWFRKT